MLHLPLLEYHTKYSYLELGSLVALDFVSAR